MSAGLHGQISFVDASSEAHSRRSCTPSEPRPVIRGKHRVRPLEEQAALVEGAIGAGGVRVGADIRQVTSQGHDIAVIRRSRCSARSRRDFGDGGRAALRGVKPVVARRPVVIRRLIPFVLGGEHVSSIGRSGNRQELGVGGRAVEIIGTVLGGGEVFAARRLAVGQPVAESAASPQVI